eukprot:gene14508-biopygen11156
MGLGPHPVARARRGLRNCKAAPPLGSEEPRNGPTKKTAPTPGGDEPRFICLGLGPQLFGPEPVARARRGARNCAATPYAWRRRHARPLYVRGWGPLYGPAHMSGVGPPATTAPPYAWRRRTPYGPHMSGVGPPAIRPRTMAGG